MSNEFQVKQKPKAEKQKQGKRQDGKGAPEAAAKKEPHVPPRLQGHYRSKVVPSLMKRFGLRNSMSVPKLDKIVLNMGVGQASQDSKLLDDAVTNLRSISGQQPVVTRAKKAISNFKLRKGQSVGCKVTLRGYQMYEFFDRFVNLALPRVRDFRGLSRKSFDGQGNYAVGIKEQIIFHEIDHDKIARIAGLDVIICTTAGSDEMGMALLEEMGLPFRK